MVGQALAHDLDVDQLHRLLRPGPVAVGGLVLLAEGLVHRRDRGRVDLAVGYRHGQFVDLALVVHVGGAAGPNLIVAEAVGAKLRPGLVRHRLPDLVQFGRVGSPEQAAEGPGIVVLHVGVEEAEGGKQPGRGRHHDPLHRQGLRHGGGEQRAVAAEGEECVFARIAPALAGDRLDRPDHVGAGDQMGAVRGAGELEAHRRRHPLGEDFARLLGIELQVAADQMRGVEVAEDQAGVGDGRVLAADVVAHRAGLGARALGPHPQRAGGIDPDLGAAAGAHLGQIDRRDLQHVAGARQQARAEHDAAADLVFLAPRDLAALDQRRLGGGAAHVEGDDVREADLGRQRLGADDAGGGARFDDIGRQPDRHFRGRETAVRLHQQ